MFYEVVMFNCLEKIDVDEYIKMVREFYSTNAVSHNIPDENIHNTITHALNNSPYVKIIICKRDGKHVGFCNLSFTYSTEVGGIVVLIEEIYVRDSFKGQGIGGAFFKFIHDEHDDKVKRYRLEVTEGNAAAIKLYERLGFEAVPYKQMMLDI